MTDTVSLRDYIDTRFDATNLAISKAEDAANRLHNVSNNIAATMLPKSEYASAHKSLEEKIDSIQKLVWIGLGIAMAMQLLIGIGVIVWKRSV